MKGLREHFKEYRRRYIQLMTAVLYNCNLGGFLSGRIGNWNSKGLCVPGLNCYSCPGAAFACPLGSLQNSLQNSAFRFPFYVIGTLLLFGILLGRLVCGFLCPFGLIQELLHKLGRLLHLPDIKKNRLTRGLSYLKYGILIFFVVAVPVVRFVPGFCKYICPAGTLEAGIPLVLADEHLQAQIGLLFSWKVFVLALCILGCMFCYRSFCRFICPLGAIYSFFNSTAFFGIKVKNDKCTGCGVCVRTCKMDIKKAGDRECIHCGECIKTCPVGAIGYPCPGKSSAFKN
ncbi:MAG: 4Fe-4S binding protein [Lachnospiraceae bacterium]|nr:4Fe-4S binding protein [Lachnospiraceae bacterium]